MEEELSAAVARFVLEAGGLKQAKAGLRAYAEQHTRSSTREPENTVTPSISITTLSPLLFSPKNTLNPEAAVFESSLHGVSSSPLVLASPNAVIDPGGGEVLDPWRSPVSRQTTATLALPQRGLDVFGWGNEEQSESVSLVTQLPPQPFSPVKTDPQDDDKFHLSTIPSPSADLTQRSASTLPRSLGQRQHVSAPSRLSPPRHPRPPITAWTTLSPRSQSPSILQRSNQRLSQMYSKEDQHQAHPLSQDSLAVPSSRSLAVPSSRSLAVPSSRSLAVPSSRSLAVPSSRHCDVRVSRMASSIQPIPGWLSGEGCLDQRLAAITPRDSKLTQSQFHYVVSKIKQDKWYLGEISCIRLVHPRIPVQVLVTAPRPTSIKSKKWYSVSRGTRIGIFYNWNLVQSCTSGHAAVFQGWKTEYDAYISYQECLLRGEVELINLPEGEGSEGDGGKEGDNDEGGADDEYFAEDSWAI